MNVLIIDDEPDILEILSEEFKHNGYAVTSASSGDEAIGILKNIKFDIVLSDYKMPNGNGMKVLEFINSLSDKPVFYFCSGQADVSVEECLKGGAREFFSKPFDLDDLVKRIHEQHEQMDAA